MIINFKVLFLFNENNRPCLCVYVCVYTHKFICHFVYVFSFGVSFHGPVGLTNQLHFVLIVN